MISQDNGMFCAVSTPAGTSGIAVIRISGQNVSAVIDGAVRIIRSSGDYKRVSEMPGYTCCFADFNNPSDGSLIDKVVITRFEAPFSYTGDEMVEISCHGSAAVKKKILDVLYSLNIRSAGPGEFTKTAFMNGKMSLTSAEAVMDIISADSSEMLRAANVISAGGLNEKLEEIESSLYDMMARIEMDVDFDDDESEEYGASRCCRETLSEVLVKIDGITDTYRQGRMLSEKMRVAFTGIPNSGKSTLLNRIAGYDRSIVTDISGTTTDTIEAVSEIEGIPVILTDTAGIRQTSNIIESMGVDRARKEYGRSDLIFYLVSPDTTVEQARDQIHDIRAMAPSDSEAVILFNKADIGPNPHEEQIRLAARGYGVEKFINISASTGENTAEVRKAIKDHYDSMGSSGGELILTSRRHYEILSRASARLREALKALEDNAGLDVVSSITRAALDLTGEISGKTVSADLARTIFDKFCIGK
ncbi:MAG: tRNA uridine-5-carboxymethylaminomethyl(34) synthesis GTPase MnmE [Clostridiales bacterium]|nr:tRNA uridine-5-carboxymethylaminomethyl(34) synthesis GTPase MnmE [Clostridiales bacterium]